MALTLALLGCGTIGGLRAQLAAENPGVGTLHLYDLRAGVAKALADQLPDAVVHDSPRSALEAGDLDGTIVSTSEYRHAEPVEHALGRGAPVLVEKPLVHEAVIARRLAETAEATGVPLYVGYSQRFRRRYLSAKELVAAGALGEMTGGTAKFFATRAISRKILARSPQATPSAAVITYLVDLMLWYASPRLPIRVTARSTPGSGAPTGVPTDASATTWAVIELEGGAVLNIGTSWDLPEQHPAYNATIALDLFGTEGFLTVDDSHRDVMVTTGSGVRAPYTPEVVVSTAFVGSHAPGDQVLGRLWGPLRAETNEFLESLAAGVPSALLTSGRHGSNVVQVTSAIDASAFLRRPVGLEIDDRPDGSRWLRLPQEAGALASRVTS